MPTLLVSALLLNLLILICVIVLLRRDSGGAAGQLFTRVEGLDQALSQKFSAATADMASRLEQTKGDLRQQMTDRLADGFADLRGAVDQQLTSGRSEQSIRIDHFTSQIERKFESLRAATEARLENFAQRQAESLTRATSTLEQKFEQLSARQLQSLDAIRAQVDEKLLVISNQVQHKLDENIREGFAQFEKVQLHLKAAEEQLRQVSVLGRSINDLNTLLKLPHLRGKFGEASLERLLADFLPAHMYEMQSSPGNGGGRADAMIIFPDRRLPIDAKFPREQVLALFESSDAAAVEQARKDFVRVMKEQAKRIVAYIQPESGTMDIALMYLPSETLYMEAVRSAEISDALENARVFPVSPNTLMMTLKTVALAYKWYEVAARFEESRQELAKAQKALGHFQNKFDDLGKNLQKAQDAYETASKHLRTYRVRVTAISGEEVPEVDGTQQIPLLGKSQQVGE